ncbi:MAG: azurin [Neisseriaceae bacterium]|nr:azurin [Neisseriaceae bacterium]
MKGELTMIKNGLLVSLFAFAYSMSMGADCSFDLKGTDVMTYTDASGAPVTQINVPASCSEFTINLTHAGKMPKAAMGHNVVIAKESDVKDVAKAGVKSGVAKGYLPENDARVIAATKLIGGGEKTSVKVPVAKIKAGGYDFFCSYPGHEIKMRGKLIVK